MPLEINVTEEKGAVVKIVLSGSIDSSTCPQLQGKIEAILGKIPEALILDFGGVTYITSMGLSLMVTIEKAMKEAHKKFLVVNIPPQIKKVFDVIAALPALKIFKSLEEADAYLLHLQREEIEKRKEL